MRVTNDNNKPSPMDDLRASFAASTGRPLTVGNGTASSNEPAGGSSTGASSVRSGTVNRQGPPTADGPRPGVSGQESKAASLLFRGKAKPKPKTDASAPMSANVAEPIEAPTGKPDASTTATRVAQRPADDDSASVSASVSAAASASDPPAGAAAASAHEGPAAEAGPSCAPPPPPAPAAKPTLAPPPAETTAESKIDSKAPARRSAAAGAAKLLATRQLTGARSEEPVPAPMDETDGPAGGDSQSPTNDGANGQEEDGASEEADATHGTQGDAEAEPEPTGNGGSGGDDNMEVEAEAQATEEPNGAADADAATDATDDATPQTASGRRRRPPQDDDTESEADGKTIGGGGGGGSAPAPRRSLLPSGASSPAPQVREEPPLAPIDADAATELMEDAANQHLSNNLKQITKKDVAEIEGVHLHELSADLFTDRSAKLYRIGRKLYVQLTSIMTRKSKVFHVKDKRTSASLLLAVEYIQLDALPSSGGGPSRRGPQRDTYTVDSLMNRVGAFPDKKTKAMGTRELFEAGLMKNRAFGSNLFFPCSNLFARLFSTMSFVGYSDFRACALGSEKTEVTHCAKSASSRFRTIRQFFGQLEAIMQQDRQLMVLGPLRDPRLAAMGPNVNFHDVVQAFACRIAENIKENIAKNATKAAAAAAAAADAADADISADESEAKGSSTATRNPKSASKAAAAVSAVGSKRKSSAAAAFAVDDDGEMDGVDWDDEPAAAAPASPPKPKKPRTAAKSTTPSGATGKRNGQRRGGGSGDGGDGNAEDWKRDAERLKKIIASAMEEASSDHGISSSVAAATGNQKKTARTALPSGGKAASNRSSGSGRGGGGGGGGGGGDAHRTAMDLD